MPRAAGMSDLVSKHVPPTRHTFPQRGGCVCEGRLARTLCDRRAPHMHGKLVCTRCTGRKVGNCYVQNGWAP